MKDDKGMKKELFRDIINKVQRLNGLAEDLENTLDCYEEMSEATREDYKPGASQTPWAMHYLSGLQGTFDMLSTRMAFITNLISSELQATATLIQEESS